MYVPIINHIYIILNLHQFYNLAGIRSIYNFTYLSKFYNFIDPYILIEVILLNLLHDWFIRNNIINIPTTFVWYNIIIYKTSIKF